MNILLIGGSGYLMNQLIIKLKKEGHRVHLLTGGRHEDNNDYENVFERYEFSYDNGNLSEIFESVNPDVTVFLGAYDTNFNWHRDERESVPFISGLMNVLEAYTTAPAGKFIFLSSEEVYQGHYEEDITEEESFSAKGADGTVMEQAESLCGIFRENRQLNILVFRLDHLYGVPGNWDEMDGTCARMCQEAMASGRIEADGSKVISLLYVSDAVEFIYQIMTVGKTAHSLYHLSSSQPVTEWEIAQIIRSEMDPKPELVPAEFSEQERRVLSNKRFLSEFGVSICHPPKDGVGRVVSGMMKNRSAFIKREEERSSIWKRIWRRVGWFVKASIPFVENMVCFIPFFMLNNRTVDTRYFARLDFYLFYVLLFAIIYGQQQAIFSAVLAVCGYLFRQMYTRSGFEVMLDYTTYVWMAQLFILGMVVGYMRDQIRDIRMESEEVQGHLNRQLRDIKDINSSNVRAKDVLEQQVISQKDSIGKLYSITSQLDQYMPEEVLFYAVEILSKIMSSPDVAIYTVYNAEYARLSSASSDVARQFGNSIRYREMGEMYETLTQRKVFINRQLDEEYPLMANAIYENDEMKMIVMLWGIPWERMTLGQANLLVVISYLIQNAALRAGRYIDALEQQRYVQGTDILEPEAFTSLVAAYQKAKKKKLTECTVLHIKAKPGEYKLAAGVLTRNLRQTDYLGTMEDGKLYALLVNTVRAEADIVISRFGDVGYESTIVERIGDDGVHG